jgi:peroxiredoxin
VSVPRLRVGAPAPDLPLVDSAARRTSLAALRGEATVLIFLRHLS